MTGVFNKKNFGYAVIITIAIVCLDHFLGVGRSNPNRALGDSSMHYRIEVWKACIAIIKDNFILGIGFGTLFKYISAYSSVVKPNIEHCHNLYLQVFTETGVFGFGLFLTFIFNIIKRIWINMSRAKTKEPYLTALSIFFMTMIHGLVDSVAFTPQVMMILSIYMGARLKIQG
jgi:O-antigen ligase